MVKQLLVLFVTLAGLVEQCVASPSYIHSSAADGVQQFDEWTVPEALPPYLDSAERRRTMDVPVMVAIPLPAAVPAAMVTLVALGAALWSRRGRRIV